MLTPEIVDGPEAVRREELLQRFDGWDRDDSEFAMESVAAMLEIPAGALDFVRAVAGDGGGGGIGEVVAGAVEVLRGGAEGRVDIRRRDAFVAAAVEGDAGVIPHAEDFVAG